MKGLAQGKWHGKRLAFFVLGGILLFLTLSCNIYDLHDDRIELEKGGEWKYYSFDPETILESLDQGNTDLFTLLAVTPEPEVFSSRSTKVQWGQEAYLRIAQALHKRLWGEPLGDQNLFSTSFDMNCSDVERGAFKKAAFNSFKVIKLVGDEETRIEHWITIIPANNLIYAVQVEYQPNVHRRKPVGLTQYRVTADEALQIAERNGGYEARMETNNDCEISVFSPTVNGGGWQISYDNPKSIYTIAVDPQTGEYRVLYSQPK